MSGRVVVSGSVVVLDVVDSGSVVVDSVVVDVLSVVVVVEVDELVVVGSVVVEDEVVVLDVVELVVSPLSSPPDTTASAIPRPSTAATRSTISAFVPPLIPVDGRFGSPPGSPGGGTSIRRVGSSCTAADLS